MAPEGNLAGRPCSWTAFVCLVFEQRQSIADTPITFSILSGSGIFPAAQDTRQDRQGTRTGMDADSGRGKLTKNHNGYRGG